MPIQHAIWKVGPQPAPLGVTNLANFWLKDDVLKESTNLPAHGIIVAGLDAVLEQFSAIEEDLRS